MLDTISTFVTHYFASCGDSLETILHDNTEIRPLYSSSKNQSPDRNRHRTDELTIIGKIGRYKRQPLETIEVNGTGLVFFPLPSSEIYSSSIEASTSKKYSPVLGKQRIDRKVNENKVHQFRTRRKLLRKIVLESPGDNFILTQTEVALRWIAMGSNKKSASVFPYDEIDLQLSQNKPPFPPIVESRKTDRTKRIEKIEPTITTTNLHKSHRHHIYKRMAVTNENAQQHHDSHWKNATDPTSGKTYYYHEVTRETQWRKPICLVSDEERLATEEKEQKEKDFFAAMEGNILNSLSRGVIPGTPKQDGAIISEQQKSLRIGSRKSLRKSSLIGSKDEKPELVRTISTMDETVLTDIIRRQPSFRSVRSRQSIKLEDLTTDFSGSAVRDFGFDSWCNSSQESYHSEHLKTLEEDSGEARNAGDSMPDLLLYLPDEDGSSNYLQDKESVSLRNDGGKFEQSSLTGFGLSWKETQALKKLVSITKEMMDTDTEESDIDDVNQNAHTTYSRHLQRATEGEIRRVLPRELEFEGSDGEDTKPKRLPTPTPRKEKAARMVANSGKTAADLLRPGFKRRNTCGTMYIRTTMSAPDKDATIRCVCGVYRSHILSSEHENLKRKESDSFDVFNDYDLDHEDHVLTQNSIPSLDEVATFYRAIFFKAQMEADCIIMSLIYVERLIKVSHGRLRPRKKNWRSILFSTMILSSKVWDDLSMWNGDFSQSCPLGVNFSLQRTNQLELAVLNTLHFKVKVPASEYAKYYFLLRSMLIKSGLGGEDFGSLNPLDVEGARRLQQVSSQFESTSLIKSDTSAAIQRSKSLATRPDYNVRTREHPKAKVGLEQVVKM